VAAFSGWNQKAAVIMNASSVERGFCQSTCFRTLVFDEGCNGHFCNPPGRLVHLRNDASYDLLAIDGMPVVGTRLDPGVAVLGRVVQLRTPMGVFEQDASYIADATMAGVVDRVSIYTNPSGPGRRVKVRVRQNREPVVGDAFATRLGQKVVVARMVRQEDMPFLADGTVPDVLINPSQMTVAGLLEALGAKAACCDGAFADATSLTGERVEVTFGHRLETAGQDAHGAEVVYDPVRGDQLPHAITMCPVYCMRLNDMVVDRLVATRVGETGLINRQPVIGARIGELESDALLAVGAASFLKESMVERSDGMVASYVEGECMARHAEFGTVCLPHDVHLPATAVHKVPRALTVLQQELACMSVRMAVMRHGDDPQYGDSAE
jgi:DNA-directed RNA polymerase II subunit RPB2